MTDASLALERLGAGLLLGGGMAIDPEPARRAIHDRLAGPLRLTVEAAAEGMIRVVNAAMTAAIRKLTVERGHDPRDRRSGGGGYAAASGAGWRRCGCT